ncbi:type II secretion system protein [Bacillus sp. 2205SS5-2]|uniref:type II secretion system protein n=1 Tax=Bacillus sp. 2205SS5-2 TaxID=3109031 RepID=UPI003007EEA6
MLSDFCGRVSDDDGFTLLDMLAVIVVLGIIGSIGVLSFIGMKERTEEDVCVSNLLQVESDYRRHFVVDEVVHSDFLFSEHLLQYDEICPVGGMVGYDDGRVEV